MDTGRSSLIDRVRQFSLLLVLGQTAIFPAGVHHCAEILALPAFCLASGYRFDFYHVNANARTYLGQRLVDTLIFAWTTAALCGLAFAGQLAMQLLDAAKFGMLALEGTTADAFKADVDLLTMPIWLPFGLFSLEVAASVLVKATGRRTAIIMIGAGLCGLASSNPLSFRSPIAFGVLPVALFFGLGMLAQLPSLSSLWISAAGELTRRR